MFMKYNMYMGIPSPAYKTVTPFPHGVLGTILPYPIIVKTDKQYIKAPGNDQSSSVVLPSYPLLTVSAKPSWNLFKTALASRNQTVSLKTFSLAVTCHSPSTQSFLRLATMPKLGSTSWVSRDMKPKAPTIA